MILVQNEQFGDTDPQTGRWLLRSDSAAQIASLKRNVGSNLDKVGAVYLVDEPYGDWPGRRITAEDLQTATDQVRAAFPTQLLLLTLDGASVHASDRKAIPPQIDLVGFDAYCRSESELAGTLGTLKSRLTVDQHLYLVPESAAGKKWCPNTTDADIAAKQDVYFRLAAADPRVVSLLNFGWWLGNYQENGEFAGEQDPFGKLPQTALKQRGYGENVVGLG